MKRFYTLMIGSFLLFGAFAQAQESDSAVAARKAVFYADSLVKCFYYQDWKSYMDFSCPTAIKYYGGKEGFRENVVTAYYRNEPKQQERPETVRLLELRNLDEQWQCVIEKVRNTTVEDKPAIMTSYLIGQSLDNGINWKFVDVSQNITANLTSLLPTIFNDLVIPKAKTEFPGDVAAQPVAEAAPKKATVKKKATPKKR